MEKFKIKSKFKPAGDQPKAIDKLTEGLQKEFRMQTLLGVTGSGKTFTIANVIDRIQKPTLVIAHNKTLAAQLCQEFRDFFPENAVEYFVSYYDYYQPEAYLPTTDTYIEKEAQINDEIDRLRHASTQALLTRKDVIIVASVSCIYGVGSPEAYKNVVLMINKGEKLGRENLIKRLVEMQYIRNEVSLARGNFRAKGDIVELVPVNQEIIFRIEFSGDEIDRICVRDFTTGREREQVKYLTIFPARHYVMDPEKAEVAFREIEKEMNEQVGHLRSTGKIPEAERLFRRTKYDLVMMREVGYCNGIENYSRHLEGRPAGSAPNTLLDYFAMDPLDSARGRDFLMIIDESHVTVPQIGAMYEGDKSRKNTLVDYGFRLPSARDNRPLRWGEFSKYMNRVIFTSATPAVYELQNSQQIVEQIIRPTGLIDPELEVKPIENQVEDLVGEIEKRIAKHGRVLVTTLTKKMAEDLSEYLNQNGVKVRYLHSDVDTLERIEILRDLRQGTYDVIVGVNLLREGLDLPEVSLVAIMDADKEGFLRSERSLIQTIGRAARNVQGKVILYADVMTDSLKKAISETNRRREIQLEHNKIHGITPASIKKEINSIVARIEGEETGLDAVEKEMARGGNIDDLIKRKEKEMKEAARELQFEWAAALRDELIELRKIQRDIIKSER
ncbi:MAG: excinuclease ABC subunit UvrB [bacterium]|nr:excinuclease ABC subunit UvrB [bacterium]